MHLAAVDVGSNTVRLMVGRADTDRGLHVIERAQRITRLGEGMGTSRRLKREAIDRTTVALAGFKRLWEERGVTVYRAVATSAVREAQNADEFIDAARSVGVDIEVISGTQEARLVMDGIAPTVAGGQGDLIVLDIGGGSTEFIYAVDGVVKDIVSTDLGVVRATERFLPGDPPGPQEMARLLNFVEKRIDAVYNRFTTAGRPLRLAGTAGTVTTLAAVDLGLDDYAPNAVEGRLLTRDRIDSILKEFMTMTNRRRLAAYPVMTEGRQDVIIAGIVIAGAVMARFGCSQLIVSDRGILEGIIEGLIEAPDS